MAGVRRPPAPGWSEPPPAREIAGTGLLAKAHDVLELVGTAPGRIDHAGLMRASGLPRATLYRITAFLVSRGLIRSDPGGTYSLGFRFLELAQNVWASDDLATVAAGELRRLRDMTGETTYLAVPQEDGVLALGRFDGAHSRRSAAQLGALKPLHCTSQGKSILAHMAPAQVDRLLARPLERLTDRTITDPAALRAQLAVIRMRGYAIDDEEIVLGTRCAGAAILDAAGRPVAAISVAGPAFRITAERAEQLGLELAAAARRIGAEIGRGAPATNPAGGAVPASDKADFLGANVLWDGARPIWLDRLAPALHLGDATVSLERLSTEADGAVLARSGVIVLARGRMVLVDAGGIRAERALPAEPRITAVRTAPDGTVWAAAHDAGADRSLIAPLTPAGLGPVLARTAGQVTSLAFDASGGTLHLAVPALGLIHSLTRADSRKRLLCRFPRAAGLPTGLAVDTERRVWVAADGGWSVVRLSPEGEFDRIVPVPVASPTGLAFGGPDLSRLYITSGRIGLALDALANAPHAGRLLAVETSCSGLPEPVAEFDFGEDER